jgi:hypothetical protein
VTSPRVISQLTICKLLFAVAVSAAIYFRVHTFIVPFLWSAIALAAVWRGRWEERVVAMAFAVTLTILAAAPRYSGFAHLYEVSASRAGVLGVGFAFLAVLLVVALRSERIWPSWAAAFQALIIVSHLAFMMRPDLIEPWAYISSVVIWTWWEIIALSFGLADACTEKGARRPQGLWAGCLQLLVILSPLPAFVPPNGADPVIYRFAVGASAVVVFLSWIGIASQARRVQPASTKPAPTPVPGATRR